MLLKAHHGPPIDLDPEEDPTGRTRRWGKIFAPQDGTCPELPGVILDGMFRQTMTDLHYRMSIDNNW